MKTVTHKRSEGFTIIEVVLVLAIAGLIFLMIFVALPALQRSQRDTARRNDVGTFVTQLQQYSTNNRGELPAKDDVDGFAGDYLKWTSGSDGEFKDPQTGVGYKFDHTGPGVPPLPGEIVYGGPSTTCDGEKIVTTAETNDRQAAVAVDLEGGGAFCQSVQ